MIRVSIITFGCKVNCAESSFIGDKLTQQGCIIVDVNNCPDYIIVNTCTVTNNADNECARKIRSLHEQHPNAGLVVTGCFAQLAHDKISTFPGVVAVFGSQHKNDIVNFITQQQKGDTPVSNLIGDWTYHGAYSTGGHTRSFLKIQDGCNYYCSYCAIPYARGHSRSPHIDDTIENVRKIIKLNIKEIVLTGINIGDVGLVNNQREYNFYELLSRLVDIDGCPRIRISSIEPNLLTSEILSLMKSNNLITPHIHIPLQSGDDTILKSMRRRYDITFYKEKIYEIKSYLPNCCIGCDVIVGYPGEDERLFNNTYDFLSSLPVSYLHVFPYSQRNNTPASVMSNQINSTIKKQRVNILRKLSEEKRLEYHKSNIGNVVNVLFEVTNKHGDMLGYSENYIRVAHPFDDNLINKIVPVKILNTDGIIAIGKVMNN